MRRNATSSNLITLGGADACDADLAASKRTIKRNVSWCGDLSSIKRIPSKAELRDHEKTALWYKGADFGAFASAEIARRREMGIDSMQALCPGASRTTGSSSTRRSPSPTRTSPRRPRAAARAAAPPTGPPGCPPPPPGWRQGPPGCPPPPPPVAPLPLPEATAVNEALPEVTPAELDRSKDELRIGLGVGGREREAGCCWLSPASQTAAQSHWDWRAPEVPMSRVRAGV